MNVVKAGLLSLSLMQAAVAAPHPVDAIRAAIDQTAGGRVFWGVRIVNVETGRLRFEYNPERLFVPASNTKLFSTALGLARLGGAYRFRTRVLASQPPDASGTIAGDLVLMGGGDPNLSGRTIPYRKDAPEGDPLGPIDALAAQVAARGVRVVAGGVAGDDTWYPWEPYPEGWAVDDLPWDYGAPVSALSVNDNVITLRIQPGAQPGDPAFLALSPPIDFYRISNRVRTTPAPVGKISADRLPGEWLVSVWGSIAVHESAREQLLAIQDPALFAAMALEDALNRHGVVVRGDASAHHAFLNQFENLDEAAGERPVEGVELAARESAPLVEDLRITNKLSQNLHAELVLRAVARARRHIGSRRAGLLELDAFLKEAGVEPHHYQINDGSGLSRLNLVSPAAIVTLLHHMYQSPDRDAWMSLLPIGGEDGTLSSRFRGTVGAGRILAKTGTVSHVSALSGYARRRNGQMLAFSILVNNFSAPTAEVRAAIDKICNLMVQ